MTSALAGKSLFLFFFLLGKYEEEMKGLICVCVRSMPSLAKLRERDRGLCGFRSISIRDFSSSSFQSRNDFYLLLIFVSLQQKAEENKMTTLIQCPIKARCPTTAAKVGICGNKSIFDICVGGIANINRRQEKRTICAHRRARKQCIRTIPFLFDSLPLSFFLFFFF